MLAAAYPVRPGAVRLKWRWEPHGEIAAFLFPRDYRFVLLNQSAAFVWFLCDGSRTPEDLARALCAYYADRPRVRWNCLVRRALRSLERAGLVVFASAPAPSRLRPEEFGLPQKPAPAFCHPRVTLSDGEGFLLRHGTRPALPLQSYLVLTHECNLRCRHCYERRHASSSPLTAPQAFAFIDALVRAGVFYLTLTGGEAFVRADVFDIIAHAVSRGLHVRVNTNGTLLDDRAVTRLSAFRGSLSLYVSLEGADPEAHDFNRGAGAFQKAFAALQRLKSAGLDVFVDYTVNRRSARGLSAAYRALDALGLNAMNVGGFNPLGLGAAHAGELYLSAVPYRLVLLRFRLCVLALRLISPGRRRMPVITYINRRCLAGTLYFAVDDTGGVSMCELMDDPFGSLSVSSAPALWNSPALGALLDANGFGKPCRVCLFRYTCNGKCRALVRERTGDRLAGNPDCLRGKLFSRLDASGPLRPVLRFLNRLLDRRYRRLAGRYAPYKTGVPPPRQP